MIDYIETITLIDKDGIQIYMGDYQVYLGSTKTGMLVEALLPESENIVESVSNRHGGYFFGKTLKPRVIELDLFFAEKSPYELDRLKQMLYCTEPHKLINDYLPDRFIWVVTDEDGIDLNYIWKGDFYSGYFSVRYIAYDPFYYGYASSLLLDESTLKGIFTSKINTVQFNKGTYESKCIIKLIGRGTNISVTNLTNGNTFTLASMNNQTIYVDGIRGQIRDSISLKTSIFDGEFILLESGNNLIEINGTNLNLTEISFDFYYTYI